MATPAIPLVAATADTSFLIALQWLDLLPSLSQVHSVVWIAERVWREFAAGATDAELDALMAIPVVQRASVANRTLVDVIAVSADGGEAEAIALAVEQQVPLVLIDDYRGRKVAQRLGLKTRGVLGHLLLLKQAGMIGAVEPYITTLQHKGFHLSAPLIEAVLQRAHER